MTYIKTSMLKKTTLTLLFLLILTACTNQQRTWTKNDWYAYIKTSSEKLEPAKIYEFSDGIIRMHGENVGYLMSKKSYSNFELTLDYRWNMDEQYKGKGKKNSGVMYNIPTDSPDKVWPKGIQFQIKENTTGDFVFLDQVTAKVNGKPVEPGASVTSPKFLENEKAYGEWNSIVIKSLNGRITQYLNGKLVNEATEATSVEGRISLNYEGSAIDFRNVKVKQILK
jgi:hypothetical protein